jgi:hypothetical protein
MGLFSKLFGPPRVKAEVLGVLDLTAAGTPNVQANLMMTLGRRGTPSRRSSSA